MADKVLKTRIQLIRNTTSVLEPKNPKTLYGELYICTLPSNETTDKVKFKIGDGRNFNDIPYYEDNLLDILGLDLNAIEKADKQIIVFNGSTGKWENEKFVDGVSVVYDREDGLSIKGYKDAANGKYPIKDQNGIRWETPLDQSALDLAVANASASAQAAGQSAINAGNSASAADTSAQTAERINEQTMNWVNNKFWWGSLEEYNALSEVLEGTFYFIRL